MTAVTRGLVVRLQRGVFRLKTRRLGTLAEILVAKFIHAAPPTSLHHDLTGHNGERVEVKFATVLQKEHRKIDASNVLCIVLDDDEVDRAVGFAKWQDHVFDCNIQQVKCADFDVLWYGLFFKDGAAIFRATSNDVHLLPAFCQKQHKGNCGEGQFHITNKNLHLHLQHNLVAFLTYQMVFDILVQK